MNKLKIPYTSEQMNGKFISCTVLISGKHPVLDCVRYSSGERSGLPVLYNSRQEGIDDLFFDDQIDEVMPASEYFERVKAQINHNLKP